MIRIMIVDDEALVRNGLVNDTDWTAMHAEVVASASNGLEALDLYHRTHPDVIISDIRMPKMDGIEMLQRLRDEGSDVQVIYLSAYDEFAYARDALRLLASDYLLKPFEDEQLAACLLRIEKKLSQKPEKKDETSEASNRYVRSAIDYIRANYQSSSLSVAQLASALGISEGHISRLFRKETGTTIAAWITQYRMEQAKELLKDVHYRIYEVAQMVGYTDVDYFSAQFRKTYSITPSAFQNCPSKWNQI